MISRNDFNSIFRDNEVKNINQSYETEQLIDNKYIIILFKNGDVCHYAPNEYDDYRYDGKYFKVIKDKQWIRFYNLDVIQYIEIGTIEDVEGRHDK